MAATTRPRDGIPRPRSPLAAEPPRASALRPYSLGNRVHHDVHASAVLIRRDFEVTAHRTETGEIAIALLLKEIERRRGAIVLAHPGMGIARCHRTMLARARLVLSLVHCG